jgi:hypothetical protein
MDHTPEKCKAMAGEMLAWLDEKEWSDQDKIAVVSGCFPVLLARIVEDRKEFSKLLLKFQEIQTNTGDAIWKAKEDGTY